MVKITTVRLFNRILKIVVLLGLCISLTACLGTVVGAVVDTTIEVVKIPFKVGVAVVEVVTDDEFTDERLNTQQVNSSQFTPEQLRAEQEVLQ